jgi:adenine phosphoribosyltransferase
MHTDACEPGQRVVLIDDLVATGGTMLAGCSLLKKLGAEVVEAAAIIDLPELNGSRLIREAGLPLFTVCSFDGL